jgi:aminomuconate-semialdehyde/2-hydroxymuconate-6-semialdehyde dehydrogenase
MSAIANAGASFFTKKSDNGVSNDSAFDSGDCHEEMVKAIGTLKGARLDKDDTLSHLMNYVDNEFVSPSTNDYMEVYNPAVGRVSSYVPKSNEDDVENAIKSAKAAQHDWSTTSTSIRATYLEKIASKLREKLEDLAFLESCDVGKPTRLAKIVDIPRAAENFDFFARMLRTDTQSAHAMDNAINITQRNAVGISALITPWNLPLYLLTWKVAPALACGNCVIIKPSELTPLTATALCEICQEVGLPKGVINLIHGTGAQAGAVMVQHPLVKLVSFTGGTQTGKIVNTSAAPMFKKVSLELGGKNPAIIFNDCDMLKAIEGVTRGCFLNSGQICLCCPRILIQEDVFDIFKEKFIEKAKSIKVGDPLNDNTINGPVISKPHWNKIQSYVDLAKSEGGTIHCGGGAPSSDELGERCKNGYFYKPTIITGLDHNTSKVCQEEIFGPVCTLHTFKTEEEAIEMANNTEYGLASSVWTQDGAKGMRVSQAIETGMVWINCWMYRDLRVPFGGIKSSGLGHEGGVLSMDFYSEPKNICMMTS